MTVSCRKLHTFPDIVLQYVHYKRDELRAQGVRDPIITVDWRCSLNGAPPQPLIDPTVNLAAERSRSGRRAGSSASAPPPNRPCRRDTGLCPQIRCEARRAGGALRTN